jgi:hypothetical protein
MSRVILLLSIVAMLAACSEAGPYGYGYAVNERPSLAQLSGLPDNSANSFSTGAPTVPAATNAR